MRAVIFAAGIAVGAAFTEKPIAWILAIVLVVALVGMAIYREDIDYWRIKYDRETTLARHWRTRYQREHEKRLDAEYQAAELETVLVAYDTHFPLWSAEMEAGE